MNEKTNKLAQLVAEDVFIRGQVLSLDLFI
jgi:hypothetical protein